MLQNISQSLSTCILNLITRWWRVDTSPGWKPPWYPL